MKIRGGFNRTRFKASRAIVAPIEPPVPKEKPSWVTDGNLGTVDEEAELTILFDYNDPHNVISHFTVSGDLPTGLTINQNDGTIYGIPSAEISREYVFTVTMHTTDNDAISRQFTMYVNSTNTEIVWRTMSDLGEVPSGAGFSAIIEAEQIKK